MLLYRGPPAEYVAEVHAAYVREVRRIFETHTARFGYGEEETLDQFVLRVPGEVAEMRVRPLHRCSVD